MRTVLRTALLLLPLAVPSIATADWVNNGVAFACWRSPSSFQLAPVAEASDPEGEVPLRPGFRKLPRGTHKLRCRVGKTIVATTLRSFPPSATGQGMGTGYVQIESLTIGRFAFIDRPTPFNWAIYDDTPLETIRVYAKDSRTFVEACYRRFENESSVIDCVSAEATP